MRGVAETRAMAKHLQSKLGADGSGESAIKNEVLLVRYFYAYAYAGRSQPDDASLDLADLRTVLEEVVELLAFEERLDYCKLVSRETARYWNDNYLYLGYLNALRRTMPKRIADAVWYGGVKRLLFQVSYLRAIVIQPYYEYQMAQMSKRDSAGKS